ncbi:hypothetical protein PROFUN_08214 [Planoprotostelium fungivorum]|uniref:Uncharacterized protein n=1 Tax=Planoprotostelium fungivorum TaxID=1890364 RepID=A0A2P6N690_9EUKA|nr:hypothetical protein PROFUN_08214 [Planoprotostelium fungivorum]
MAEAFFSVRAIALTYRTPCFIAAILLYWQFDNVSMKFEPIARAACNGMDMDSTTFISGVIVEVSVLPVIMTVFVLFVYRKKKKSRLTLRGIKGNWSFCLQSNPVSGSAAFCASVLLFLRPSIGCWVIVLKRLGFIPVTQFNIYFQYSLSASWPRTTIGDGNTGTSVLSILSGAAVVQSNDSSHQFCGSLASPSAIRGVGLPVAKPQPHTIPTSKGGHPIASGRNSQPTANKSTSRKGVCHRTLFVPFTTRLKRSITSFHNKYEGSHQIAPRKLVKRQTCAKSITKERRHSHRTLNSINNDNAAIFLVPEMKMVITTVIFTCLTLSAPQLFNVTINGNNTFLDGSCQEDCLSLAVFVPATANASSCLPVRIFIHYVVCTHRQVPPIETLVYPLAWRNRMRYNVWQSPHKQ